MLGNAAEAQFIHNWYHSPDRTCNRPPEGWTHLGGGSFRSAYLSPSGVVYKVQKNLSGSRYQTNYGEWETWKRLYLGCKMPEYSRLPRLNYFPIPGKVNVGVIAIEKLEDCYTSYGTFIDKHGDVQCWGDVASRVSNVTRVGDLYGDNVMIDRKNNLLVPTDLGDTW